MKTRSKIIAGVSLCVVIGAILVVFACPQVAATRYSYFDPNNGRLNEQWVSFGRVYRESVEETDYSKLLKSLGFDELPAEWKRADAEELGIRRFFYAQQVSYRYGKIASDARMFSIWLGMLEKATSQEKREYAARFRALLQKGTPDEIDQYVKALKWDKVNGNQ